jgi:hypothetical protein
MPALLPSRGTFVKILRAGLEFSDPVKAWAVAAHSALSSPLSILLWIARSLGDHTLVIYTRAFLEICIQGMPRASDRSRHLESCSFPHFIVKSDC